MSADPPAHAAPTAPPPAADAPLHWVLARRGDALQQALTDAVQAAAGTAAPQQPLQQPPQQPPQQSPQPVPRRMHWHVPAHPSGLPAAAAEAAQAAQADGGVVVAVGGDGTLNSVAQACWALDVPMGVVAQGTFNYFCRAQGLPQLLPDAVAGLLQALQAGQLRPVAVGRVNGQLFLVNASLGLYPKLLKEREQASARWGRHRLVALVAGALSLLRPHLGHRLALQGEASDGPLPAHTTQASTLFVGNNALQLAQVGLPEADAVRQGALGVVALAPKQPWAMLGLLWRAWRGRLAEDPGVHNFACQRLTVRAAGWRLKPRIRVAFDGERAWMTLPLQFERGARPLRLVAAPLSYSA